MMQTADKVRAALEALSPTQEKVDLAVKTAVEIAQPSRVILFGSWARGEAKWDSDLDLAVLMPDSAEAELVAIRRALRRKLDEVPMSVDLVMTTEGFADRFRREVNSIYYRILQDGQVVYEQRPLHPSRDSSDQSV
ncbi:MAG: nucleotidyltransferase domain-containing protein [Terracidiphilus sp.]